MCNQLLIAYELCAVAVVVAVLLLIVVAVAVAFLHRRSESAFCGLCGAACDQLAPTTSTEASTACACCDWLCVCVCSLLHLCGWLESYMYILLPARSRVVAVQRQQHCLAPFLRFCLLNYKTNGPHINKLATRNAARALDGNAVLRILPQAACGMWHAARRRRS